MGIYIKDMEMPRNCRECPADMMFCYWCGLLGEDADTTCFDNERRADCPLVSVPPHGRLGDLDKLHDNMLSLTAGLEHRGEVMHEVRRAPTIIPAEEAQP